MLHPLGLNDDAFDGRLAPVKAWLEGGGTEHRDVNSYTATRGATLLRATASAPDITAQHFALPNEVLCHVLGYWENTSSRLSDLNPSFRARRVRKKQKARGTSRA